jgi:hypothetical protein
MAQQPIQAFSDAFELSNDEIHARRREILKMLKATFEIEFGKDKGLMIRFYSMTEGEYQLYDKYTFKVVFGKMPSNGENCEGFCYDYRRLLNEKYLFMDQTLCNLPIVCSSKRWNQLVQAYETQIHQYSVPGKPGILLWPLERTEVNMIFRNNSKPILFLSPPEIKVIGEGEYKFPNPTNFYFDESTTCRFLPIWKNSEPKTLDSIEITSQEQQDPFLLKRYRQIIDLFSRELQDLDIDHVDVESEDIKRSIFQMFRAFSSNDQIVGMLLRNVLQSVFKQ